MKSHCMHALLQSARQREARTSKAVNGRESLQMLTIPNSIQADFVQKICGEPHWPASPPFKVPDFTAPRQ